ncbi:inhibin beta A chain isoform X2 [Zootermopsis nevadensis]|uniref:inhibin beta A chain isoform X2 n=1 Tax=Zootermopsis nevadensis TaxID=136037 RepID=UPI000B8E8D90|nr:inhibin beta A chain isoform X2 [Zootermopsis nevadensis]
MLRGCLWLTVVLFLSVSIVTCADCTERHHHHQHHQPPCPNCVQPAEQKRDEIRLETIKRQILSKLGLKEKPNVTSPVPREVILETLYRAEETGGHQDGNRGAGLVTQHVLYDDDSSPAPSSTRPPESEPDDFYGRTSEIIAFAEPGHTLNGQPLLEFSHAQELGGVAGTELRVKAATLWVLVDFRSPLHRAFRHTKNLTLWVFTVSQRLHANTTHLSGLRRIHGDGSLSARVSGLTGLAEVRPDDHCQDLVLLWFGRQGAPETVGGLLGVWRPRRSRSLPVDGEQGPAAAIPRGAHGPDGYPAGQTPGAGLFWGAARSVLQAAILRELQAAGLGRLDHRT